jgi:GNAT superfamily N-acetyltransferase
VNLRMAAAADAEAIAALKVEGWRDAYTGLVPADVLEPALDEARVAAAVRALLGSSGFGLLAEHEEAVAGFATCDLRGRVLDSLHVRADWRGRGLGTALVRRVAGQLAGPPLHVHVVRGNDGALALYERLGAVRTGEGPSASLPGVEEVRLRWDRFDRML